MHGEPPVPSSCIEGAAEQRRALAHADEPVAPARVASTLIAADGIADGDLQRAGSERDLDVGTAVAVTGRVRERLLQDAVRAPVDAGWKRTPLTVDADHDVKTGGTVALHERIQRGQPGRRLDASAGADGTFRVHAEIPVEPVGA